MLLVQAGNNRAEVAVLYGWLTCGCPVSLFACNACAKAARSVGAYAARAVTLGVRHLLVASFSIADAPQPAQASHNDGKNTYSTCSNHN